MYIYNIYFIYIKHVGRGKHGVGLNPFHPPAPLEASDANESTCPSHLWHGNPALHGPGWGAQGDAAGCGTPLPTPSTNQRRKKNWIRKIKGAQG